MPGDATAKTRSESRGSCLLLTLCWFCVRVKLVDLLSSCFSSCTLISSPPLPAFCFVCPFKINTTFLLGVSSAPGLDFELPVAFVERFRTRSPLALGVNISSQWQKCFSVGANAEFLGFSGDHLNCCDFEQRTVLFSFRRTLPGSFRKAQMT